MSCSNCASRPLVIFVESLFGARIPEARSAALISSFKPNTALQRPTLASPQRKCLSQTSQLSSQATIVAPNEPVAYIPFEPFPEIRDPVSIPKTEANHSPLDRVSQNIQWPFSGRSGRKAATSRSLAPPQPLRNVPPRSREPEIELLMGERKELEGLDLHAFNEQVNPPAGVRISVDDTDAEGNVAPIESNGSHANSSNIGRERGERKQNSSGGFLKLGSPQTDYQVDRRESDKGSTASMTRSSAAQKKLQKATTMQSPREPWQIQKAALHDKLQSHAWSPHKKLSPAALDGIRALHAEHPDHFTTSVLAKHFKVSVEAIRRILKSKWRPKNEKEEQARMQRWEKRGERIWKDWAGEGIHAPKKWRTLGIGTGPRRNAQSRHSSRSGGDGEQHRQEGGGRNSGWLSSFVDRLS